MKLEGFDYSYKGIKEALDSGRDTWRNSDGELVLFYYGKDDDVIVETVQSNDWVCKQFFHPDHTVEEFYIR